MTKNSIKFQAETLLPTEFGSFRFRVYKNANDEEAIAIIAQDIEQIQDVPVRVHSSCFTAEVIGSLKCDCKQQLDYALHYIAEQGGVVIYLPQEGRGIGLSNKIRAYALQESGHDTIEANHLLGLPIDARCYDDAAAILRELNIQNIKLMTNNPVKLKSMADFGFSVAERIPVLTEVNTHSHEYLETKRSLMGHMLKQPAELTSQIKSNRAATIQRPFVHVNFAMNKEGQMNQQNAQNATLSCEKDWQRVHELRERYSAVVVGANTWVLDKPQLTVRKERLGKKPQRQPDRVIFAGNGVCSIPPDRPGTSHSRRNFVVGLAGKNDQQGIHINAPDRMLNKPLKELLKHNISSLLVEGGATLLKSFISQNLVDRFTIYVCTDSIDEAVNAISKKFPELPVEKMDAMELGDGILLSYSPTTAIVASSTTKNLTLNTQIAV